MHPTRTDLPRLRYLPAVDGLRGLAVAAVLGYHADVGFLPGGFLGVELFFVVSGFLITSLLLAERRSTGAVDLRRFWVRRARRLLPALAVVLVAVAVVVRVALPAEVARTRGGLLAAVGYVTNWELVWSGQSYFEALGRPPLLRHLWSLAVEEQYYLVWPVAVAGLLALRGRRAVVAACTAAAGLSTALMWVLVDPSEPSRAYYGTDTRAAGLAIGGLLATTLVALRPPRPVATARTVLDLAGGGALAAVVLAFVATSEYDPALYRGGFLSFAAVSAVLLFAVTVPGSAVARALSVRPLVEIGVRSYGLYLWHWPVFQLTRPGVDIEVSGVPLLVLRLALTTALAELSLRLVERPARDGAIGRWWAGVRAAPAGLRASLGGRLAAAGAAGAGVALALAYVATPTTPSDAELAARLGATAAGGAGAAPTAASAAPPSISGRRSASTAAPLLDQPPPDDVTALVAAARSGVAAAVTVAPGDAPAPAVPAPSPRPVHAVGDSVLLASAEALAAAFDGGLSVDAVVGRQPHEGVAAVEAWAPANPGVDLVVSLGSNGLLRDVDVDRVMAAAGPERQVVWLTVAVPRRWEAPSNEVLRQRIPLHPNARLVDWHATVAGDPSLLGRDRVHPRGAGTGAFAAAVRAAFTW